jgi:hypothetical protein
MPTLLIRNPFRFGAGNSQGTNLGSNKSKHERGKSAGGPLAGLNNLRKSTLGRIRSMPKDGIGRQQQQKEEEEPTSFDYNNSRSIENLKLDTADCKERIGRGSYGKTS